MHTEKAIAIGTVFIGLALMFLTFIGVASADILPSPTPTPPPCYDAWIVIDDNVCFGYDVYVDGVYQFTEGQGGIPDGYCAFTVSQGYHTIKIQKDGCSETIYTNNYFSSGGTYQKILSTYWCECACDVSIKIDDNTCKGYGVYVDGVYQFTEGQDSTPDGFCSFYVTEGTHILEIRKNGCTATKTHDFRCGVSYTWVSMPDYWCECGERCDNPPTVSFDKTLYYEGDTVHATVSTIHSSVHYEIKDCSNNTRKSESASNGASISYTIPAGTSECCYWTICFYWNEYHPPLKPQEANGNVSSDSYQCSECYEFYACPCEAYVTIEDSVCFGYEIYVDGAYQFTEGQDSTPDGYCTFTVSEGYHTIEIRKDSCSETIYTNEYFSCGSTHQKILSNYWCNCNDKPDIIIQDITWSPGNPEQGDTILFTVVVKNHGSGPAGSSAVKYYVDGSNVDSDSVPALSAGSSSTQTFTWTLAEGKCGDVQVKAVADANNAVDESEEGNNEKLKTVSVACQLMEGDVTLDGYVTITDARDIGKYKAGLISLNADQLLCADTTDDGAVTMIDVMHILQWKVDPDRTVGILYKPLWESPADDGMRKPVE